MFRKTILTFATASVITAAAMGATASTASAGVKFYFGHGGYGHGWGGYGHYVEPYRGRAHVDWCLNRYRSYNPSTDTFRGYDGYDHRCISPYS